MFIRTATNGQPLFTRFAQTFSLPSDDPEQTGLKTALRNDFDHACLEFNGYEINGENDVPVTVTPGFFMKGDGPNDGDVPRRSRTYPAWINAIVFDDRRIKQIILAMMHPLSTSLMYHMLLELTPDYPVTYGWSLSGTIVLSHTGEWSEWDKDVKDVLVDPALPGWETVDGAADFGYLPLQRRLQYFAR